MISTVRYDVPVAGCRPNLPYLAQDSLLNGSQWAQWAKSPKKQFVGVYFCKHGTVF